MKFTDTLKLNYEFHRLYSKGKSAVTPFLVVYARRSRHPGNRIGFTVSNKIGHAVVRNRIRRRLREVYRLHEEDFLRGTDLVIVARARAAAATYRQLEKALLSACGNLGVYSERTE